MYVGYRGGLGHCRGYSGHCRWYQGYCNAGTPTWSGSDRLGDFEIQFGGVDRGGGEQCVTRWAGFLFEIDQYEG